ncbi:MAG: hypothetical protein U0V56_07435 [Actinomycetota bacterium]
MTSDLAGARGSLETAGGAVAIHRLSWLADRGAGDLSRLPAEDRVPILPENLLRRAGTRDVSDDDVRALAAWPGPAGDIAFMSGRADAEDLTGVPAVVDLAAMRSAMARHGGDPSKVNPLVPADPATTTSVQVDLFRSEGAYAGEHRTDTGATPSATPCCGGRNRRSTGCAWYRPEPASAIR